jgi:hypothetical protein
MRSEQELTKSKPNWNVPVYACLDNVLEEDVIRDTHSTKSEFTREAVKRKLKEMGFRAYPFLEIEQRPPSQIENWRLLYAIFRTYVYPEMLIGKSRRFSSLDSSPKALEA